MSEKTTFQELVDSISEETNKSKKFTHDFIKDFVSVINEGLDEDGEVNIAGFGKFELRQMDEREGYNPQTEEKITIPAHNKIVFKPYKDLRELVNAPYAHMEPEILESEPEPAGQPEEEESSQEETEEKEFIPTAPPTEIESEEVLEETEEEPTEPAEDEDVVPFTPDEEEEVPEAAEEPAAQEPTETTGDEVYRDRIADSESSDETSDRRGMIIAIAAVILLAAIGLWYMMSGPAESPEPVAEAPETEIQQPEETEESPAEQQPATEQPQEQPEAEEQTEEQPAVETETEPQQPETPASGTAEPVLVTVQEGQSLWRLANRHYKDPYLWPWIYNVNNGKMGNPNIIVVGRELRIPQPKNADGSLSRSDSLEVATGYVLTYRWFKNRGDQDAKFYLWAAQNYHDQVFDRTDIQIDKDDLAFAKRVR
ncbi:MAG: HU family DNA-binding protein [Balneolaceae bacterium]|nr:HU family DNA-binding protein [Balneolaceae bacterium]